MSIDQITTKSVFSTSNSPWVCVIKNSSAPVTSAAATRSTPFTRPTLLVYSFCIRRITTGLLQCYFDRAITASSWAPIAVISACRYSSSWSVTSCEAMWPHYTINLRSSSLSRLVHQGVNAGELHQTSKTHHLTQYPARRETVCCACHSNSCNHRILEWSFIFRPRVLESSDPRVLGSPGPRLLALATQNSLPTELEIITDISLIERKLQT